MDDPSASPWAESPALVFWEVTRACELRCDHCRAEAIPDRDPAELSTGEISSTLKSIGDRTSCVVVFTGGDPFQRPDLPQLVSACSEAGLKPALTPSTTSRLTRDRLRELQDRGLAMMALSLDGPDASSHDTFRGEPGSYAHTMRGIRAAEQIELPLQINTTVSRQTWPGVREIGNSIRDRNVFRWALFFLVRTGTGRDLESVSPGRTEEIFAELHDWSKRNGIKVKTTNAPHYRRWKIQHADATPRPGIVDGDGILFISHRGQIYPSGFLPVPCGNVRRDDPLEVYRSHPLLNGIRSRDLSGKCARCEFIRSCGGSRANAFAETGDPLASDPRCAYVPGHPTAGDPPSERAGETGE